MPSKTILDCSAELQKIWPKLLAFAAKKQKGCRLQILETHITPEEQKQRFNVGRNGLGEVVRAENIITEFDGTTNVSLHNYYPARALRFRVLDTDGLEIYPVGLYNAMHQLLDDTRIGFVAPNLLFILELGKDATRID